jgi:hypothetical protein
MVRLERAERERAESARLAQGAAVPEPVQRRPLFLRFFKGRAGHR